MDTSSLLHFFSQYGLIVLYVWLLIGIFIVPVPEEVVMITVGILISRGVFSFAALFVACFGSLCGVTFSYLLGRFLEKFVLKYGKWIGLTQKRLAKGDEWFRQYGKWSLPVSYFILGTRHVIALVAGMAEFNWNRFMLYAYPAGVVWVTLYVILGYLAGHFWLHIFNFIDRYTYYFLGGLCLLISRISHILV